VAWVTPSPYCLCHSSPFAPVFTNDMHHFALPAGFFSHRSTRRARSAPFSSTPHAFHHLTHFRRKRARALDNAFFSTSQATWTYACDADIERHAGA